MAAAAGNSARAASGEKERKPSADWLCVFGEEAQSDISRMRQPAEGTQITSLSSAPTGRNLCG